MKYFFLSLILIMLFNCSDNNFDPPSIDPIDYTFFDEDAAWSPDGSQIAYVHCDTAICGIFVIDTLGLNKKMVYQSGKAYHPRWSPDGQWIVFVDNKQIFKMKINGDSLTQLTHNGWNRYPDWSPDGDWIVFDSDNYDSSDLRLLWKMKNNGSNKRIITKKFTGEWIMPNWNSTGEKILFSIYEKGGDGGTDIAIIDSSGNNKIVLFSENGDENLPKFSSNNSIVFEFQPYASPPNIYSINEDGSNLKQLTTGSCISPDWSPDGEYIVYSALINKKGHLWIMDKDGANKRQLTF